MPAGLTAVAAASRAVDDDDAKVERIKCHSKWHDWMGTPHRRQCFHRDSQSDSSQWSLVGKFVASVFIEHLCRYTTKPVGNTRELP